MRRIWRYAIAAVLLVALLAVAGWAVLGSLDPRALVESRLEKALGHSVRLKAAEFGSLHGLGLDLELWGLELLEADGTAGEANPPILEVPHSTLHFDGAALLRGELMPSRWLLESPRLSLHGTGTGELIVARPLPTMDVVVTGGQIEWRPPDQPMLLVSGLELRAQHRAGAASLRGSVSGQLRQAEASASFALEFEHAAETTRIDGDVQDLDLRLLTRASGAELEPSGRASGQVQGSYARGSLELSVDLGVEQFRLELPEFSAPIAPEETRIQLSLRTQDGRLELRPREVRLDDLVLSGSLNVSPGPERRVRGTLNLGDFRLGTPGARLQLLRLVGLRHQSWTDFDARSEGGWMEDIRLDLDLELDRLGDALAYEIKPSADEFRISGSVRDGVYRPSPGAEPLERISGEIAVIGNRLEVRDLAIWRNEMPLPRIDIAVNGMHRLAHLPKLERKTPPGPGVPIPGLATVFRALSANPEPAKAPVLVEVRNFDLRYPAFVFEFRNANGILDFPDGNLRLIGADGTLGGAPARVSALWNRAQDRVSVEIAYKDGPAPPRLHATSAEPTSRVWAQGEFRIQNARLEDLRIDGLRGQVHANGARVEFSEVQGMLARGPVTARGHLDIAREGAAPFSFEIDAREADVKPLLRQAGLPPDTLDGTASAQGRLAGVLAPGQAFLAGADVDLALEITDGTVGKLPAWVLLARLATPLGWRGLIGRPLPFDAIRAQVEIDHGILRADRFILRGPELRVTATGEIDLLSPEKRIDLIAAMLFLETVDQVLRRIPVIGPWVLGDDESLVALYVELEGPWSDPKGSYLRPNAVQNAVGLAGRAAGGVKILRDLLLSGLPTPEPGPTEEPDAEERPQ